MQAASTNCPPGAAATPTANGPHQLQPLQSIGSQAELEAEFDRCLRVLQHGHIDDVVEIMKLMCYEMMDLQRSQAAAAAGSGGLNPQAKQVQQLFWGQADALVVVLTFQTQQVGQALGFLCSLCFVV